MKIFSKIDKNDVRHELQNPQITVNLQSELCFIV